jgi:hypothetical protein
MIKTQGTNFPLPLDRWVFWVTVLTCIAAAIGLMAPVLVALGVFFLVGIPLVFAPTLALYLLPSAIAYRLVRTRAGVHVSILAFALTMILTLAASSAFATKQNGKVAEVVAEQQELNFSKLFPADPVQNFVSFDYLRDADELDCSWHCQRILFSGYAKSYAIAQPEYFNPNSVEQRVSIVHRIVSMREGCDNALLSARSSDPDIDFLGKGSSRPYLWDVLPELASQGLCFRSDRVDRLDADLVEFRFDEQSNEREAALSNEVYYDWRLSQITHQGRFEVHVRSTNELEMVHREVWSEYREIKAPLSIELPGFISVFRTGGWAKGARVEHRPGGSLRRIDDLVDYDFSVGN